MSKLLAILLMVFSLSGCVATALVVGATAGGAVVYDQRSIKTQALDRNAASAINNRFAEDRYFRNQTHVSAAVLNRVALLVGQVPNEELKDRAYQIATSTRHIDRVYNQITIGPPLPFSAQSHDSWITTSVKTQMLATKNLSSTQIKVVTEDGVVYLMGLVSRSQAELATDVARGVSGVRKVVKIFQYAV